MKPGDSIIVNKRDNFTDVSKLGIVSNSSAHLYARLRIKDNTQRTRVMCVVRLKALKQNATL